MAQIISLIQSFTSVARKFNPHNVDFLSTRALMRRIRNYCLPLIFHLEEYHSGFGIQQAMFLFQITGGSVWLVETVRMQAALPAAR